MNWMLSILLPTKTINLIHTLHVMNSLDPFVILLKQPQDLGFLLPAFVMFCRVAQFNQLVIAIPFFLLLPVRVLYLPCCSSCPSSSYNFVVVLFLQCSCPYFVVHFLFRNLSYRFVRIDCHHHFLIASSLDCKHTNPPMEQGTK